jgi:hypothetical protein
MMGSLGISELLVVLLLMLVVWAVPVAFGVWVLILLNRIAKAQEATKDKLAAMEQFIKNRS